MFHVFADCVKNWFSSVFYHIFIQRIFWGKPWHVFFFSFVCEVMKVKNQLQSFQLECMSWLCWKIWLPHCSKWWNVMSLSLALRQCHWQKKNWHIFPTVEIWVQKYLYTKKNNQLKNNWKWKMFTPFMLKFIDAYGTISFLCTQKVKVTMKILILLP